MRRACCASTFFASSWLGTRNVSSIVFLVISLKTTRRTLRRARAPSSSARCQQIASPSRSGSAARKIASASLAADFRSSSTFLRVGRTSYSAANPFLTSTPRLFLGRSRTCPIEARTSKSRPRYLLIVFALAGDSTMTRFFATLVSAPHVERPGQAPDPGGHLQLGQPGQQLVDRPAAPRLQLLEAGRGVTPQQAQHILTASRIGLGDLDHQADLLRDIGRAPHQGRAV